MLLGLTSNLNYKKWSLSFTMRSNLGAYNYNSFASGTGYGDALAFSNFLSNVSSSIKKTRFVANQQYSDIYIENASFLRMDNINLSHNFGRIGNAFNLVVNANVQNVFLISGYSGLDPEVTDRGLDVNFYPRPRLYTLGINLGF
jgi:iron complex outermembrane receptor protein